MAFVLDTSVVMAWCFEDEASVYAESVLDSLRNTEAFVPSIWPLEVANVLLVGIRRRRVDETKAQQFLANLTSLPIHVDSVSLPRSTGAILQLARTQDISAYDASYVDLAMRRGLELATRDVRMREAATRLGVPLLAEPLTPPA